MKRFKIESPLVSLRFVKFIIFPFIFTYYSITVHREVIDVGLVCVAKVDDRYYRLQITAFEASEDSCEVKFLDYGGYGTFYVSDLKQIRSDFLTLPFQVITQDLYLT